MGLVMSEAPAVPAMDVAQACVQMQVERQVQGWRVGQRVRLESARGLSVEGVIASFTCGGEYEARAIVKIHPRGWWEAVPLAALRRVEAPAAAPYVQQSPARMAELRARARA